MKVRTSITLSEDLLAKIDAIAGGPGNRSGVIERLLRRGIRRIEKRRLHREEMAKLNRMAAWLEREGDDLLDYQADPFR